MGLQSQRQALGESVFKLEYKRISYWQSQKLFSIEAGLPTYASHRTRFTFTWISLNFEMLRAVHYTEPEDTVLKLDPHVSR